MSRSATAPPAEPDWSTVLDEYERVLEQHAAAVARTDVGHTVAHTMVDPFEPPASLGPLPDVLRPRAVSLAARTRELIAVAQRLVDEAPAPTAAARPRLRRRQRSASFDQRV